MQNLEAFNAKHLGRTCFIIGSGPSIHFQDLEPLKDYVTIAVNAGYLAFPQSDYFVTDDWAVAHWSYFFNDLKNNKQTTPLLYEDKLAKYVPVLGEDRVVLFRHRKGSKMTDAYTHENKLGHIFESRTSVGTAIHIAHIMGCSKVVLLGVDCCRIQGRRWFWQFKGDHPFRNDGIPADRYVKTKHEGRQSDTDLVSILRSWDKLAATVSKKCDVVNASVYSVVTAFPKVPLEECFDDKTKF